MNYAGGGVRFVAALIDNIVLLVPYFITGAIFSGGDGNNQSPFLFLINLAISIGYWVFYQASAGQTLGKKVMGIKVVDLSGNKPTAMTFFLREIIGKMVSAIILFIGYLMILWDAKKQGLHDKIAGTIVVKVANAPIQSQSPATNTTSQTQ